MNNNCRKRNVSAYTRKLKISVLYFWSSGVVTVCAFFLPPKAWIVLLGIILIVCGITLLKK